MMRLTPAILASLSMFTIPAAAADGAACATPRFSDVGWTDITATTAVANELLTALGYSPDVSVLSVAITFRALEQGDTDIFLGNWMPLQEPIATPLIESGAIEVAAVNLTGARIGFAVPQSTYDAGLKTYADIDGFKDRLEGQIYGIEAGSSANETIQKMITDDTFGLGDFTLVESSEQAMLAQVSSRIRQDGDVLFFGWQPHPMNLNHDIAYLADGNDVFGPDDGGATVQTVTRKGLSTDCPNLGAFLSKLVFDVAMEDRLMSDIIDKGMQPDAAAVAWLQENPETLARWLDGVTTLDGQPGLAAVEASLGG
ncbi:glycine/betaine ABC transporter substrate-binding protein [Aureimonas altamirensis]|uniref:Glycine/betaine ABC transporter substrate-binding protein n=1 Tax=Aureimonas altamirensis TaxID=370622 RepID=A0A0B1PYY8_9HYPH|nr:choline ABC transporter substrate-binding protein [Aureimonas altamirensis]KHJ53738.1 glycine/betaine ABC transporter substrate-binding protein [Aureimonas altamirensis]